MIFLVLDPACARPSGSDPSANQHLFLAGLGRGAETCRGVSAGISACAVGDHKRRRPRLDTGHGDMRCYHNGGCAICGIGQSYGITLRLIRVGRRKHIL